MKQEQLVEGLEPIESRYKQDYSDQEREMLYKQYFWMTSEMWRELCGLMLAKERYRIPAIDDFGKIQRAHRDKFRKTKKVREECETCNGTGIRMFLQRRWDKKHIAPAARCDCRNGENWAKFPSVKDAEGLPGFQRLLTRHEAPFHAIAEADQATGVGCPSQDTKEEPEVEIDDTIPF